MYKIEYFYPLTEIASFAFVTVRFLMAFLPSRHILGPLRPFLQELSRFSMVPLEIPLVENEFSLNYTSYMHQLGHLNATRFPRIAMTEGGSPLHFFHTAGHRCLNEDLLAIARCDDHRNCGCFFRRNRVKSNSTGFLMIDAFFALNNLWRRIIDMIDRRPGPIIIVDVANTLNSRENVFNIHRTLLRSKEIFPGKEEILAQTSNYLDDDGLMDVGDRFAYWRFLLCYFRMTHWSNHGTEASFVFVNQGAMPGFNFSEVDVNDALWINVSFLLAGQGMHHILGYNGSDDAVIVEISRRLLELGRTPVVVSDDSFSEFVSSIHRPFNRVTPVGLKRIRSLRPRRLLVATADASPPPLEGRERDDAAPALPVADASPPPPASRRRERDDTTSESPPAIRRS